MDRNSSRIDRLHRVLDPAADDLEWLGDQDAREALSAEWLLARHIGNGQASSRKKYVENLEDLAESERRVRTDHTSRYPIELLQNAHDACADAGIRGKAWFRITPASLLVANQGAPFTADRIRSLIRLGGSSKKPGDAKHHTIGYKGIGFTSVFEISDTPQVISQRIAFGLDSRLAVEELARILDRPVARAPARYFPFPAAPEDWREDADQVDDLFAEGAVTVIRLPFLESINAEEVAARVRETLQPTTLLLMPALDAMDLGPEMRWVRRRTRKLFGGQLQTVSNREEETTWLVVHRRVPVAPETVHALDDPVWADVRDLQVLVGIPWHRGRPDNTYEADSRVHAYFPTDESAGRRFLIHGDFFLESNRRHVQAAGPGGEISRIVAQGIVDTVGVLSESIAREAPEIVPELTACLAEAQEPQGYGRNIAVLLNEDLAKRPILRTVMGETVSPREARILGAEVPPREAADLATMLRAVPRLVDPAYERAASDYLQQLGATVVPALEVARRLDAQAAPSYERAVVATSAWWRGTHRPWSDKAALSSLRILMGTDDRWHIAGELCEPIADVPPLPSGLERATYRPPRSREAAEFLREATPITKLDLTRSLDIVLSALKQRRYGRNPQECRAAHDFALAVFRRGRTIIRTRDDRGAIPVPVRTWRRGTTSEWRPASETYFSRDWIGHSDLEKLYRRFSDQEFLAADPPGSDRARRLLTEFYSTLGVASEPRLTAQSGSLWYAPHAWRNHEGVIAAAKCPDEHPQSGRTFETAALDRLSDILLDINAREARALVSILGRIEAPYGPPARIWCTHSQHRRPVKQSAIGLQRWLLQTNAWVPVHGDPAGRSLVRPNEAWVDVNGKALQAVLPQAEVTRAVASKLELPSAARGSPQEIVNALLGLRGAYPELNTGPEVAVEGAFHLLQKLEAALHRSKAKALKGVSPWLPAHCRGEPRWARQPAVQDIRLPSSVPLEVLPFGSWTETAKFFSLPKASRSVAVSTTLTNARPATLPGLEFQDRVNLTALLTAKGADLKAVAQRLGRLEVNRCDKIATTFSLDGYAEIETRLAHLVEEDGGARLHIVDPVEDDGRNEIARLVAEHLDAEAHREAILLYLVAGASVLTAYGVRATALDEAREAIARYRREHEPEVVAVPVPGEEPLAARERTPDVTHVESGRKSEPQDTPPPRSRIRTAYGLPAGGTREPVADLPTLGNVSFGAGSSPAETQAGGTRPTGARGGTGLSGHATVSSETRRAVEARAIELAMRFAREHCGCIDVRDVQQANKGWDLEFMDNERWWPVEVKGFAGSASAFILTRNELRAAKSRSDYQILLVTGVGTGAGEIVELNNPGSWLSEEDLQPMSWEIANWAVPSSQRHMWSSDA